MLTVLGARKVLGKQSDTMSDEEIQKDVDVATLLKDIFFEITSSKAQSKKLCNNVHDVK